MYAALKNLKISCKQGNEWLQSKKEGTVYVSGGSNARTNVRVMYLEVEMHKSSALNIFKRLGGTFNAFQRQTTAWKVNVTLLMSVNKEIRCAGCL